LAKYYSITSLKITIIFLNKNFCWIPALLVAGNALKIRVKIIKKLKKRDASRKIVS